MTAVPMSPGVAASPDYSDLIKMYQPSSSNTFACLVYGFSGSGKTTFAGTFPKPFFIDADRGMKALMSAVPSLQLDRSPKPFTLVLQLLRDAKLHSGPFAPGGPLADVKTLVLDGITSLVDDYMMPEVAREGKIDLMTGKPGYDEYGKLRMRLTALASVIKDLAQEYYFVTTALVEEEKDEASGMMTGKPMITGKYRDKAQADYDETYYMQPSVPVSGPMIYKLYAKPYNWYKAKTRLTTVSVLENPSFDAIVKSMKTFSGPKA